MSLALTKGKIAVAASVLLVAAAGGGVAAWQLGVLETKKPAAVEQVPADVDMVVHVDMAVMEDAKTRQLLNTMYNSTPSASASATAESGPESMSESLQEFENETGLDPTKAEEVVIFGQTSEQASPSTSGPRYVGIILHADWSNDAFVSALEDADETEYTKTSYSGTTVYESTGTTGEASWVGLLGDGQYVIGTEQAVKDTIDVTTDDADSWGGDLRSTYENTRDGYVTMAMDVPEERIPDQRTGTSPVDPTQYNKVRILSMVYYTKSDGVGLEMRMKAKNTDAAKDVADVTDGGVSFVRGSIKDEAVKETLRDIEVSREESTVVVTFESTIDSLEDLFDYLKNFGSPAIGTY